MAIAVLHGIKIKLIITKKWRRCSTLELILLRLLVTPTNHPLIAKARPVGSPFQVLVLSRRKTCANYIIKGQQACITHLGLNSYPFRQLQVPLTCEKKRKDFRWACYTCVETNASSVTSVQDVYLSAGLQTNETARIIIGYRWYWALKRCKLIK